MISPVARSNRPMSTPNIHDFTLRVHVSSEEEGRIYLLWPCDAESLYGFVMAKFDDDPGENDSWNGKCFFSAKIDAKSGMPTAIIALRVWDATSAEDIAVLAHECFHAAEWMLNQLGQSPPSKGERFEPWEDMAYLLEWIMKRALARLLQN